MNMEREFVAVVVGVVALAVGAGPVRAETVYVPNASFELPEVPDESPWATQNIDDWQKAPAPDWWLYYGYTEEAWLQCVGVFLDVPFAHIENIDQEQGAFLFATPGVEMFQDLTAQFEIGRSYNLTIGAQGGGDPVYSGPIKAGSTMEIRLYYRDQQGNRVTVGSTVITNPAPNYEVTYLPDRTLHVPVVAAGDAWAGQHIGVQLIATVSFENAGGFWDLDNVRLDKPEPLAGDFNTDGDVDEDDLSFLRGCWTGPAVTPPASGCDEADLDDDEDVDQSDFGLLQENLGRSW